MKVRSARTGAGSSVPFSPWWLEHANQHDGGRQPAPPLVGRRSCDVLVVGAGYTGLWTALALKQMDQSRDVVVIDSHTIGAGPSGLNGGIMGGYWPQYAGLLDHFGLAEAGRIVRAGSQAQEEICSFIDAHAPLASLRNNGMLMIATSEAQERAIQGAAATANRLGYADEAVLLTSHEVRERCDNAVFGSGILFPEAATIDPAGLVLGLAERAHQLGVHIFEMTPAQSVIPGTPVSIQTPLGQIRAKDVVIATNSELTRTPLGRPFLTNLSSYVLATEPVPHLIEDLGWTGGEAIRDARMFLHWCRTTQDNRIIFGTGGGPMAFDGRASRTLQDEATVARLISEFKRVFPLLSGVRIERVWSGPIDMASDHLPWFTTYRDTRIHYGVGFSGHGINASWIAGQSLATLALGGRNKWTESALCARRPPRLPPEPFRYIGGQLIKSSIKKVEDTGDLGLRSPRWAQLGSTIPEKMGLRIGTRR